MTEETATTTESPTPPKRSCLPGCIITLVVLAILGAGLGVFGYFYLTGKLEEQIEVYTSEGFEPRKGQLIDVTDPVQEKTVFVGQIVRLRSDVGTDVAIIAQQAEVYGKVEGTVYFTGQQLFIKSAAEIEGDVDIRFAQQAFVEGTVGGEVKGSYQQLIDRNGEIRMNSDSSPEKAIAPTE